MPGCILVVEDDDDVRELLAETLQRAGYEVATARHGGEALAWLRSHKPAAIILDLMMPEVDGWTVLSKLDRAIPVIVLSAVRDAVLPPAVTFLPKPVKGEKLIATVAARAVSPRPNVELVLYVADGCERSQKAIEVLAEVLGRFEPGEIECDVVNVAHTSREVLDADGVDVTPTLIVRRPLPLRLIGDIQGTRFLTTLLDVAEVERRR